MDKKVILISVDETIGGAGILALSSYLKKYGYDCQVIFLPSLDKEYSLEVLTQLEGLCSRSILIGVTAMAYVSNKAFQIAAHLKKLGIPLVLGGIHATLNPEACLHYFDYVCVGEGEDALLELATCLSHDVNKKKIKPENIKNIWTKKEGILIKNKLRPLIKNVNALPFPDYNIKSQLTLIKNKIVPLKPEHFCYGSHNLNDPYLANVKDFVTVHATRGCPNNCKYCCNYDLKILYKKCTPYVRVRDVDNIIYGLKSIKKELPQLRFIWFTDDDFLVRDLEDIKKFSKKYSEEINLPFMCYITPGSINELKLKELRKAKLHRVQVGIQSGSEKTRINLYNRTIKNEQVIKNLRILQWFNHFKLIPPEYQIINTNPLETEDDLFETVKLLYSLPRPYYLEVFNLVFFPGSRFAKEYGGSKESVYTHNYVDEAAHFASKGVNPYNKLIRLLHGKWRWYRCGRLPSPFLRILLKDKKRLYSLRFIINLLDKIPTHRRIYFSLPPRYRKVYLNGIQVLLRMHLTYVSPVIHAIRVRSIKIERHLRMRLCTLKKTKSLCPTCLNEIDAFIYKMGKEVYMGKTCPDHGTFDVLIEKDYSFYRKIMNKKARLKEPVPIALMIPFMHKCNLKCEVCYLPYRDQHEMTFESFKEVVRNFEGNYINISGGEPTLRADLCDSLKYISQLGKKSVLITNGIKLSDGSYVKELKDSGLNYVYFPLNSLDENTSLMIDKKKVLRKKLKALRNLKEHNVSTSLSTLLVKGVNEDQLKKIFSYYLKNGHFIYEWRIRGAVPVGRCNSQTTYTLSELLELLCATAGINKKKFISSYSKRSNYYSSPCRLDIGLFYYNEGDKLELLFPEINSIDTDKIRHSMTGKFNFGYRLAKNGGIKTLVRYIINRHLRKRGSVVFYSVKLRNWSTSHTLDLGETSYCPSRNLAEDGKVYPFCYSLILNEKIMHLKKEE